MLLRISFFQQHQRKCRYVASSLLGYDPLGFRRYAPSIVDAENSSMISRARVHAPTHETKAIGRSGVAGPIWPANRRLDCSTPRRAISLSVNLAREAAMGAADGV